MDINIKAAILPMIGALFLGASVTYAGFMVTDKGVEKDIEHIRTITNKFDGRITTNRITDQGLLKADRELSERIARLEITLPQLLNVMSDIRSDMSSTKDSMHKVVTDVAVLTALKNQEDRDGGNKDDPI